MSDLILPTDIFCPCCNRAFAALMMIICCLPCMCYQNIKESLCDNCDRSRRSYRSVNND